MFKHVTDAPFVKDYAKIANDGYSRGWHERNGGNLSYRIKTEEIEQQITPSEIISPAVEEIPAQEQTVESTVIEIDLTETKQKRKPSKGRKQPRGNKKQSKIEGVENEKPSTEENIVSQEEEKSAKIVEEIKTEPETLKEEKPAKKGRKTTTRKTTKKAKTSEKE